ncbi:MAG: Uma2 family endonuclease [Caldilineaceae bacterium SB0661_bin_32]|uniref:Uma2 family endonuclease n=1 Tax=Caldilineaceae bacterium SB0661_bin_32 TaxID=2605255 RepID=A0A6B1D2L0_9CHLR|nr:Uma2 family endonuclease [Caldilineaceae bacterium SB0661_bin_32]
MGLQGIRHTPEICTMHSPEVATPVWRIATLFPYQGAWSEQEYLALETNRRVEFDDGFVEVHDAPTDQHQAIILYLSIALNEFALQTGGVVRTAGLRLRLWDRKYREPDIVLLRNRDSSLRQENFWDGADLAIEVVSQSLEDRERDLVTKRAEYERVGIQEYWIVDSEQETVTVLSLSGDVYSEGDLFGRGDIVKSPLLPELALPVAEILDAN